MMAPRLPKSRLIVLSLHVSASTSSTFDASRWSVSMVFWRRHWLNQQKKGFSINISALLPYNKSQWFLWHICHGDTISILQYFEVKKTANKPTPVFCLFCDVTSPLCLKSLSYFIRLISDFDDSHSNEIECFRRISKAIYLNVNRYLLTM